MTAMQKAPTGSGLFVGALKAGIRSQLVGLRCKPLLTVS